jgi:hypothetical protein
MLAMAGGKADAEWTARALRGGLPAMRPDQVNQLPVTRAGSGPAPASPVVVARRVIITGPSDGLFVYSPAVGAGNLAESITAMSGTDLAGNAYLAGQTSYHVLTGSLVLALNIFDGLITWYTATTQAGPYTAGPEIGLARTGVAAPLDTVALQAAGGVAIAPPGSLAGVLFLPPSGDVTGAADSAALANAFISGLAVQLLPGTYYIDVPLSMATGTRLLGTHGSQGTPEQGSTIVPGSAWAGASMITFPNNSGEQEIGCLNLDASSLAAGTVVGISASGLTITGLDLHDLLIIGTGFNQAIIGGGKGWWLDRVTANGTNGTGFSFGSVSDTTWTRCHAIGCGGTGFFIGNCANGKMIGCKAEFCTTGFNLSSAWVTGNGAGGFQLTGCSTDRNIQNGLLIDATGTAPMNITGHMARRDGSNGGSWGGVTCNASTVPVSVTGLTTYMGVNDDGSGSNSPKYGFQIISSSQNVNLHSGVLLGATAGLNDDGSNTNWFQGPFILTGHGTTAAITWNDVDFLAAERVRANGLPGAVASSRYAGATTGGAPVSGTFNTGDFIIDTVTPAVFVCTAGGSPGVWAAV